jgi:hypothetical protein
MDAEQIGNMPMRVKIYEWQSYVHMPAQIYEWES